MKIRCELTIFRGCLKLTSNYVSFYAEFAFWNGGGIRHKIGQKYRTDKSMRCDTGPIYQIRTDAIVKKCDV